MSSIRVLRCASTRSFSCSAFASRSRIFLRYRLYVRNESHRPWMTMIPMTATRIASAMSVETMASGPQSPDPPLNTFSRGYHARDFRRGRARGTSR